MLRGRDILNPRRYLWAPRRCCSKPFSAILSSRALEVWEMEMEMGMEMGIGMGVGMAEGKPNSPFSQPR